MTTPVKKTALTDPDNVMWIVESTTPSGEEVTTEVAAAARPKMSAYSALVAAAKVNLLKKFDESKVKRGKGGKFAKKADSGGSASTPAPAKKVAAPTPGKKLTNKVIYGKHANGTIIPSSDGESRLIYNEAGNNWTVQRRTPDGGWETVDILGKGAAYKKAQELSALWGEPEVGTPAALTPVPGPVAVSGPFAPGWNDLSGAGITNFKKLQVTTAFETANPSPSMSPALLTQNIANIAQTYGLEPEQVLALIDEKRGDTAFSDAVQAHLNGDPFPDSLYPSVAKKTAALKKATGKKIAPPAAAVAPAPPPIAPPSTPSAPTYTAMTNPVSLALLGEPFEFDGVLAQSNDAMEIDNLRMLVQVLTNSGAPSDEIDAATKKYMAARKKYTDTYGVSWSVNHNTAVQKIYAEELAKKSAPATPVGIPGAPANVTSGTLVQTLTGGMGTVNGPVTMPSGQPGVSITLGDGTVTNVNVTAIKKAADSLAQDFADAPVPGTSFDHPTLGVVAVAGPPMVNPLNQVVVPVIQSDGTVAKVTVSSLKAPPPLPPGTFTVGTTVTTPTGDGTIIAVSPTGSTYHVELPDGTTTFAKAEDTMEIPPSALPSTSASTSPSGFHPGVLVNVPGHGTGVIASPSTSSGTHYVMLPNGSQVEVHNTDLSIVSPTAPPASAPAPAPNPGVLYDANGVPLLTPSQHFDLQAQFQNAGVNWYNSSESLFDAAYAASQATGMSIEDVLKYADANFHNSSKDGGKPIQAKIAKWAKSSKGKAHIQATLGSPAAAPVVSSPLTTSGTTPTTATPSTTSPTVSAVPSAAPGTDIDISGVSKTKQTQAFVQFTAGYTTLGDSPGTLAQKAADVAKNTGLTPEQVLAIVDAKKAAQAGVPDGKLFSTKVLGHLNGKPFPTSTPAPTPGASATGTTSTASQATAFSVTPGFEPVTPADATKMQAQMVAATTPLTPSQRASLRFYTGSSYTQVNKCLRFNIGCTPKIKQHIANGTAGMRPTTQNITTFRGTGFAAFGVSNAAELEALVGQTVREPGFSSTSVLTSKAFGGSVAMQVEIPAGTPGAYVGNFSQHKSEREFILPPGTKFRILEVKPGGGGMNAFVRVEVVPA